MRGESIVASGGRTPTFEAHREIAVCLLAALGHSGVAVPETPELGLLPGVVTNWRIRFAPVSERPDVRDGREPRSPDPAGAS